MNYNIDKEIIKTEDLEEREYCKKISYIADKLYNEALVFANNDEVSIAVNLLNKAIEFDKVNYEARNLLGLMYYRLGEISMSLKHWIISSNIYQDKEKNKAHSYLADFEKNEKELAKAERVAKLYNESLKFLKDGNDDIAIMNLRKIDQHSNFIKGKNLLALCYIKRKQYGKAIEIIENVLKVDNSNYKASKYYNTLIEAYNKKNCDMTTKDGKVFTKVMLKNNLKKKFLNKKVIAYFVAGILVTSVLFFAVVIPAMNIAQRENIKELNKILALSADEKDELNSVIAKKDKDAESLNKEIELLKNREAEIKKLNDAFIYYDKDAVLTTADKLTYIDSSLLNKEAKIVYDYLKNKTYTTALAENYKLGRKNYDVNNNKEAIKYFTRVLNISETSVYSGFSKYFLARSYEKDGEKAEAIKLFKEFIKTYPNSDQIGYAQDRLKALQR